MTSSRLRIYGIVVLICMAASCSRVPKHILSERKMRVILYDMLLAEAIVEVKNESFSSSTERQTVYDAVFAKHQISQADYDSALIWYGKHMDLYMAVYKLVLKDVNAAIAALGDVNPNPITGDASEQDSIDIWIFKRSEAFNPNRIFNTLTFDIMPQNPYPSGSSYVLGVSVWGISRSLKNKPVIHLNAVQADTIISISKEITGDGYYEASVGTLADKVVSRIYGYILLHDIDVAVHRIYLNDIRLMKYNQQPETPDDAPVENDIQ